MEIADRAHGVELEKAFTTLGGEPFGVDASYFEDLRELKKGRGEPSAIKYLADTVVGITTPHGEETLDNGFNLGESATGPVRESEGGLIKLSEVVSQELQDVDQALESTGAGILNMSNHPLTLRDTATYQRFVAPKPAYAYVREVRNWNHKAGIDASAQNSPSTDVSAYEAADAVTVMIGLGAGIIALYGNSPFSECGISGKLESRMDLWNGMFGTASKPGDQRLHYPPNAPLETLRDYFNWMFGPGTNMFFVPEQTNGDVKLSTGLVNVDGDPSLLEFLSHPESRGHALDTAELTLVRPTLGNLALHQFLQFSGARVRFGFHDKLENEHPGDFLSAMSGHGTEVEDFMERASHSLYIEGRDAGANFADDGLIAEAKDDAVARSVVMSASALQAGLLRDVAAARQLVASHDWGTLMALRQEAARVGLVAERDGVSAGKLADAILQLAGNNLDPHEQWMLAYPQFVLATKKNGANRALEMYDKRPEMTEKDRIRAVLRQRIARFAL